MMLLDVAPDILTIDSGGGIPLVAGAIFFVAFAATAYVVFKLLKKTVKMAFRIAIVAVILLIAIIGSISFWWLGSGKPARPERPRPTQPK